MGYGHGYPLPQGPQGPSISVEQQDRSPSGPGLSGYSVIINQSDGCYAHMKDLNVEVQYRTSGGGGWPLAAVEGCNDAPRPGFLLDDQ